MACTGTLGFQGQGGPAPAPSVPRGQGRRAVLTDALQHDGKNLRLNSVSVKPKPYFKEPGGLQTHMSSLQRKEVGRINVEYLAARYGQFIRKWTVDDPHPQLKRSLQHFVGDLPPEELFH